MKRRTQSIAADEEQVIPLVHEQVNVGKQARVTGITTVRKIVREVPEIVDEPLNKEEVVVERIPVNQYIDQPAAVREESGTTVIPVMEEVLVVEKKLLLKEEVRITKRNTMVHKPQTIVLRREEAIVEQRKPEDETPEEP